ncbi:hypothetical protein BBW65_02410 [Helicobacter enhydrae]|uniref:Tetratricopeptide repeat protein n=1 Tax=Helicobacter enhydrae TaxID=222136 RepID=A0A1B1U4P3_9HELI|nr:hypothetical protein [Helicobacter enhydrae]ANV97726.1 hypothetical protein BBW65_02410 [Helicobacter enhydrae]
MTEIYAVALIDEREGRLEEALRGYHKCIAMGINAQESKVALVRLKKWRKFANCNSKRKKMFESAGTLEEIQEFERWLLK